MIMPSRLQQSTSGLNNYPPKPTLKPSIVILTFLISIILIPVGYFILGLIFAFLLAVVTRIVPPAISKSSAIILGTAFYSFLLIFGFTPLIGYLNRRCKYLITLQFLAFFIIILIASIATIPKALINYNRLNYKTINEPIRLAVRNNVLLIENRGELFSEGDSAYHFTPTIYKSSIIWSYQIPEGSLIEAISENSPKGREKRNFIVQAEKVQLAERGKGRDGKDFITLTNSLGIQKFYKINDKGKINEVIDRLGNKPSEIPIEASAYRMWDKGNYIYLLASGANNSQLIIYKLDTNNNEIKQLDAINVDQIYYGSFYDDEIILNAPFSKPEKYYVIFNINKEKFTLNFQLTGNYDKYFDFDENYIFWYGRDGVIMVDKNTNQFKKFKGKV